MHSHKISYEILGNDMQVVEVELNPKESLIAKAGAMTWIEDNVCFETRFGDGSRPYSGFLKKITEAIKRVLTGESLFMTHFINQGQAKRKIAFASPTPGKIIALDLAKIGGELTCQKYSFLCATLGTQIGIALKKRISVGVFGGEGFILQKIKGDGLAFIQAGGTVVEKKLAGNTLKVDTGCIVAFTAGIEYRIERVKGLTSILLGGEGLFMATLKGHGKVYLQSMPFSRLANRILKEASYNIWKRRRQSS